MEIGRHPAASITAQVLANHFGEDHRNLVKVGIILQANNLEDVVSVDGYDGQTAEVVRQDGRNKYFSQDGVWTDVQDEEIALYKVNHDWFLRQLMDALEIGSHVTPQKVLEEKIWTLGQHWIKQIRIPILVVRNIGYQDVYQHLNRYLEANHAGKDPALVIALDRHITSSLRLTGQNVLVRLEEAMVIEQENFTLYTSLLAEKMGASICKTGFSPSFHSLKFNGEDYTFTSKQSEALELMAQANRPLNQHEILEGINSSQRRLRDIFKTTGGKIHPAWDIIIKRNNKGLYWLDESIPTNL